MDVDAGGNSTYDVSLATRPVADVLVELTPVLGLSLNAVCSSDEGDFYCLTFTPDNWNEKRNVSVTSDNGNAGVINHRAVSSDTAYDGLQASVTVNRDPVVPGRPIFLPLITK